MKNNFFGLLFALVALCFFSCKGPKPTDQITTLNSVIDDPHSFSEPEVSAISHLALNLAVDFDNKKINGSAIYDLKSGFGDLLIVDTKGLQINEVNLINPNGRKAARFHLAPLDSILGSALHITLDKNFLQVEVKYNTTDQASALMWLDKIQTENKKFPYLFTQSQSIYARTWIPIPDGPGMRFTYSADISVPPGMMAAMSAENTQRIKTDGKYHFEMKIPIPAYLLALAVGDFEFAAIGDHTGVYASPSILQKAKNEFIDLEKMLTAAENLYGKYPWGRYDVLVLPPSFPFGGMENPMLTFATPSVIAGDRSLTSLLAHELAHSWSGNLITNATWDDFWLNEGFTTYFESRIMESLYGKDYADMISNLGYQDLVHTIADKAPQDPLTKLHANLKDLDPELSMSDIAYEKGKLFLRMLEEKYGRPAFDEFLKNYFGKFQFQSMDALKFEAYLNANLIKEDTAMRSLIKQWIYEPGLPGFKPSYLTTKFDTVNADLEVFLKTKKLSNTHFKKYSTHEWLQFIRHLPTDSMNFIIKECESAKHFATTGNAEIRCMWLEYLVKNNQANPYKAAIKDFLTSIGRRRFLMPIYTALVDNGQKEMAVSIYDQAKTGYHPITKASLEELLLKN